MRRRFASRLALVPSSDSSRPSPFSRWMSEGAFEDMRPHLDRKSGPKDIDESTDTYDTKALPSSVRVGVLPR